MWQQIWQKTTLSSDRGSTAAGRDVIGIPPDQLPAIIAAATTPLNQLTYQQRATIATLEEQLKANRDQVRDFFSIVHQIGVREFGIRPDNLSKYYVSLVMIEVAWNIFKIVRRLQVKGRSTSGRVQ